MQGPYQRALPAKAAYQGTLSGVPKEHPLSYLVIPREREGAPRDRARTEGSAVAGFFRSGRRVAIAHLRTSQRFAIIGISMFNFWNNWNLLFTSYAFRAIVR